VRWAQGFDAATSSVAFVVEVGDHA
jgi:hypothetical protein